MFFIQALLFLLLAFVLVVLVVFAVLAGTVHNNFLMLKGKLHKKKTTKKGPDGVTMHYDKAAHGGKKIVPKGEGQYVDFVEEPLKQDE